LIADTTIQVPAGATHLFVAAPDSLYSDNSDPNGDFKIRVSEIDATPPTIVPSIAGTLGGGGWYVSDVTVSWSVTDPESAVISTSGCDTTELTADTAGTTLTCMATSEGGTDSESVTIRIDQTAPSISASRSPDANDNGWNNTSVTVTFVCSDALSGAASCAAPVTLADEGAGQSYTGNSLTYTVDEQVTISCSVSDALSGVDSDTCADVSGPASAFPLGTNTYSATALDLAGNAGTGSTSFVVLVTEPSLCGLVRMLSDDDGIAGSLCVKLEAAEASQARGHLNARDGQLAAFVNELEAQSGKAFTTEEAALLIALGDSL
jgi:hypothetical protein